MQPGVKSTVFYSKNICRVNFICDVLKLICESFNIKMPRVKASPKKCVKTNTQQTTNTWVFLFKGEVFEVPEQYTGAGTPDMVTLKHPKTNQPAMFLFSPANNSVQEILTFSEEKRSWFIDESVKSDGKMNLSTPIDPIFLVLPYLRKHCVTRAIPLDNLLVDDEFPETERLLKSSGLKYLNLIADKKGDDELNAFKYNEEKTLLWLQKKTERVADILKQKNIHVGGGAVSATFVKSKSEQSNESYLRYAHGIVSEYLMDDLSQKLLKQLCLPEESSVPNLSGKRKSTNSINPLETKKPKTESSELEVKNGALDLSGKPDLKPKSPVVSSKEKARAKAASGSKNITSFFKKK